MESVKTDGEVQQKIAAFCFDNLNKIHADGEILEYPKDLPDPEAPIFVTWLLDGTLRG